MDDFERLVRAGRIIWRAATPWLPHSVFPEVEGQMAQAGGLYDIGVDLDFGRGKISAPVILYDPRVAFQNAADEHIYLEDGQAVIMPLLRRVHSSKSNDAAVILYSSPRRTEHPEHLVFTENLMALHHYLGRWLRDAKPGCSITERGTE